jgi:hypothetical protein
VVHWRSYTLAFAVIVVVVAILVGFADDSLRLMVGTDFNSV